LAADKEWDRLYKMAHKIKGAAGMLQVKDLTALLAKIEHNAKEMKDLDTIESRAQEATRLFAELEIQLQEELEILKKELPATD
jgi:HPt (histidine-containing phosphotransfer) domain-containing protein